MGREIYFDNNATTSTLPAVRQAMVEVLGVGFGNPSSAHGAGERGRRHLFQARFQIADLVGAAPEDIVFTSSGTESNNLVFASHAFAQANQSRVVTTDVEHSSIIKMCHWLAERGTEIVSIPVDSFGQIDVDQLRRSITPETNLVSVQWVNNESGVIQPIAEIGAICRSAGVAFHTDAAQAVGKLAMKIAGMPVDYLSLTGHKFHGPAGAGALYARSKDTLAPMFFGGPQEGGLRPGTENLAGIVGLGKAAEIRKSKLSAVQQRLAELRDRFEQLVLEQVPDVRINGDTGDRICNTSNLRFERVDGQALVARLDQAGIRCSQSSACTNQRPEPSYVLRAMGLSEEEAYSSVRFSFCEDNTEEEIVFSSEKIAEICQQLRSFSARLRKPHRQEVRV
jgi:cysteine desulfurase